MATDVRFILGRIRPNAEWGWSGGEPDDLDSVIWRDLVQIKPTQQEIDDEDAIIVVEEATELTVKQQLKALVTPLAGSGVQAVTNAQVRDLVEVLVAIVGGVDLQTRLIKPPADWDIARELLDI